MEFCAYRCTPNGGRPSGNKPYQAMILFTKRHRLTLQWRVRPAQDGGAVEVNESVGGEVRLGGVCIALLMAGWSGPTLGGYLGVGVGDRGAVEKVVAALEIADAAANVEVYNLVQKKKVKYIFIHFISAITINTVIDFFCTVTDFFCRIIFLISIKY